MQRSSRPELLRLPFQIIEVAIDRHRLQPGDSSTEGGAELLLLERKGVRFVRVLRERYVRLRDAPVYLFRQRLQSLLGTLSRAPDLARLFLGTAWPGVGGGELGLRGGGQSEKTTRVEQVGRRAYSARRKVVEAAEFTTVEPEAERNTMKGVPALDVVFGRQPGRGLCRRGKRFGCCHMNAAPGHNVSWFCAGRMDRLLRGQLGFVTILELLLIVTDHIRVLISDRSVNISGSGRKDLESDVGFP